MKFAVMKLADLKLMEMEDQPLCFDSFDEAENYICIYELIQVAIVQLDEDEEKL
jgi:hypothetical protein